MGSRLRPLRKLSPASPLLSCAARAAAGRRLVVQLDFWVDPEAAFLALATGSRYVAWLDGGPDAVSGHSYLCLPDSAGLAIVGFAATGTVTVSQTSGGATTIEQGTVLDVVDATLPANANANANADVDGGAPLGWVGWIGYETGAVLLQTAPERDDSPDSAMLFVDCAIAFDHARRRVSLATFDRPGASQWRATTEAALRAVSRATIAPIAPIEARVTAQLRDTPAQYRAKIVECLTDIAQGDAYQLCLTNQIIVEALLDPFDVYRRLRRINPGPRGGLIRVGDHAIASSSPETFLSITATGEITTRPIKGTRPRGATPEADVEMRDDLVASEKEQAENVMIVDLMRNDFSRVARLGSVAVPDLFRVEAYANVFQLVSTVTADLDAGVSSRDVIRSAFPAGSMTGAPKLRAVELLAERESGPRGAYAGAFGSIGVDGGVELSMTIRTAVFDLARHRATVGTGGGITALSDPDDEVAEMLLKAVPVLRAMGADLSLPDFDGTGRGEHITDQGDRPGDQDRSGWRG